MSVVFVALKRDSSISVKLGGRVVGHIVKVGHAWQYRPKIAAQGQWGKLFATLEACKESLR